MTLKSSTLAGEWLIFGRFSPFSEKEHKYYCKNETDECQWESFNFTGCFTKCVNKLFSPVIKCVPRYSDWTRKFKWPSQVKILKSDSQRWTDTNTVSSSISFEKGEFSELVVAVVSCSLNVRCLLSAQFLQNNSCTVLQFFILINTLSGTRSPGNFLKRLLDSPPSLLNFVQFIC